MAAKVTHPSRPALERDLEALAAKQHCVVGRTQLEELGFSSGTIDRRLQAGWLTRVHRGIYAVGPAPLNWRGRWLAAVLACGEGALLSHRSAAAFWGLTRQQGTPIDVTSERGRRGRRAEGLRASIAVHRGRLHPEDRAVRNAIPVTSLARTLFDLAEVVDPRRLASAWEEADRLNLLQLIAVERVCERSYGRRALRPIRRLLAEAQAPVITRSVLEDDFAVFCHTHGLSTPVFNTAVLGFEVDALWSHQRLIVELDGFAFHRHRGAFERDRARDTALQAAGYRVLRITHRRLESDAATVAREIRQLLG